MNSLEQLKIEYLEKLKGLIEEWKSNSKSLREEECIDEAIFEQIKVNVGDIFYKMFNISYNNACKQKQVPEMQFKQLYDGYMKFFDKIPASWKEKLIKDKQHNMMDEYYKEELKLNTVESIKGLFNEYYERFVG